MLGGVGNVGTLSARRRLIAAAGGGGGSGISRSGTSDSNHVHALSALNTVFAIPNIDYVVIPADEEGTFGQTDNDDDTNFSVKDITFTTGTSTTLTIYIGVRIQKNDDVFHNDFALGALQVHSPTQIKFATGQANPPGSNTNVNVSFATTDDTLVSSNSNANTRPDLLTYSFANATVNATFGRWGKGSSTNSTFTGPTDGVATAFQNGTTALPEAGEAVVPQVSNQDYMYTESSQTDEDAYIWLRIPNENVAANTAHKLVMAYHFSISHADFPLEGDADENVYLYIED